MQDRTNTIFGWTLGAGIVALGFSALSARVFEADRPELPEQGGYPVEATEVEGGDTGPSFNTLLAGADAAAGEKIFAKCTSCHTIEAGGPNKIGPNLHGVVGEPIGAGAGGYAFSGALSGHGGTWTFDELNAWLKSPKAYAPGTKMSFAGLSSTEDRANVIAYLNSQGSNLPLPPPDAAPEGDGAQVPGSGDLPAGTNEAGGPQAPGQQGAGNSPASPGTPGAAEAGALAQPAPKAAGGSKAVGTVGDTQAN